MNVLYSILEHCQKTNTQKIQVFLSKTFRIITNTVPYLSNCTLLTDLHITIVTETAKKKIAYPRYSKFRNHLQNHTNAQNLLFITTPVKSPRRLKWQWHRDLIS